MASNLEKLGGYIKGKVTGAVTDFAYGAKAAAVSANPAMFGAMEKGISSLTKSFRDSKNQDSKRDRREQAEKNRQRGFQEENAREQRYAELQQQKIFESMDDNIKKILELLKKDTDASGLGGLLPLLGAGTPKIKVPRLTGGPDTTKVVGSDGKPIKPGDLDGKRPPKVVGSDGKPIKPGDLDGKRPPKVNDPEFKKIRLRGLGFFDDIIKSFEKIKTSLFKTSIKFPELERYATKMSDDMGKSVKAIENMSEGIKASRGALLAIFGPQFGGAKGDKLLAGAALDSRLGKLAKTADAGAAAQDFVKGLSFGMPAELAKSAIVADNAGDVVKGADSMSDVVKGVDSMSDVVKGGGFLTGFDDVGSKIGKMFEFVKGFFGKMGALLAGPLKFFAELTDMGPFLKSLGKVAGPLGVIVGVYDGIMNAINTEGLQEQLGKVDITAGDRVAGFLGGFIGSIGGLMDLLLKLLGIDIGGTSIQDYLTSMITKVASVGIEAIMDYFKSLGAVFEGLYAVLTGDQELLAKAVAKLEYLGEKWFGPIKDWWAEFQDMIGGTILSAINIIKHGFFSIKEYIKYFGEKISTSLNIYALKFAKTVDNLVGEGKIKFAEGINFVVESLRNVVNWAIEGLNSITSGIIDAIPDRLFGVSIKERKASLKKMVTISTLEDSGDTINVDEMRKNLEASQASYDAKVKELEEKNSNAAEELDKILADYKAQLDQEGMQAAAAAAAARDAEKAERAAKMEEDRKLSGLDPTPEEKKALGDEAPASKEDTKNQTDELTSSIEDTARNATDISVTEQELAEIRSNKELDHQTRLNEEMRRAYEVGVNKMLAGQSQLVQSLLGPLLKGQGGEGGLGTFFKNIFGDDSPLGGIGDALGNLFGKGKGGWFDGLTGWFKDNLGGLSEFGSAVGDLFKVSSGTSVGGSIFSTPGFGGGTPAGMNPIAALFGSKLSSELGLTGVGANAAFDVAQSLFTSGTGMAGVKSALAGPGGFAGGLGAIMSIFGGDSTTLGGALSGGLGIYQLLKGGGLSNMLGGGIAKLGAQMFTAGATGLGSSFMGFGTGMTDPTMLFQKNALLSERLGAGAGAIGTGFTAKAIGDFLSGGYTANKYLTTAGGVLAGIGATGALGPLLAAGPAGIVIGVVAGLANRLFGRKAKEYTDIGMDLDIGTNTTGQVYKDWIKKGGAYRSDKRGTEYENLDTGLVEYFNESASAIQDAYGKLAETMGLSAEAIVGFTKSFSVSLKDLSPAEQQRKIAELVQQYADAAITSSYGNISRFAIEGEKTTDTFVRMASAVENVSYWFDALGYSVEETKDMFTKMVDAQGLATPAVSGFFNIDWMNSPYYQQMMAEYQSPDYAGGRAGAYMYDAGLGIPYLGPEYFAAIYAQQEQAAADFVPTEEQMNLAIAGAQANFIEMFGGQQQFGQYMQGYFSNFYTPQEQAEFMARQATIQAQEQLAAVQDQLDEMGLAPELSQQLEGITSREQIDAAKEEFRKAVEAAMEEGNMDLAAQLIMSGETFIQAAEMQLRAAEMNGEAAVAAGDYMIQDTGAGGGGITGSSTELNTAKWTAGGSGTGGDASVVNGNNVQSGTGGTNQSGASVILTPISSGGNAYNNSTVNNVTVQDGVRNYHPILSIDVRGTTSGFLGLGSR